jgi:hypothetical protein
MQILHHSEILAPAQAPRTVFGLITCSRLELLKSLGIFRATGESFDIPNSF